MFIEISNFFKEKSLLVRIIFKHGEKKYKIMIVISWNIIGK